MTSTSHADAPEPTVLETPAGPVEYVDVGSGPPLLFVHGSPGGCDQGVLMTRFLSGSRRVIALSRPGYRGTALDDDTSSPARQADLAAGLMDTLGIDRFDVVCWSGGGPSTYLLAAGRPERVGAVVALAAVSKPYEVALRRRVGIAEEKLLMNRLGRWLAHELADRAPRSAIKMLLAEEGDLSRDDVKQLADDVLADEDQRSFALGLLDTVTGPRRDGFTNDMRQFASLELPLAEVTAPVLLVHASTDADVGYDHSLHAHAALPHSRLVTLEPGTHVSAWLGPDAAAVQSAVLEHLAALQG